jgi:PIN domain nuclease of toxin-antitoxin system
MEIALLSSSGRLVLETTLDALFEDLESNPAFRQLPLTYKIARDLPNLGALGDPADQTIAATARVHRLRLVTSDPRIIESGVVPVVE